MVDKLLLLNALLRVYHDNFLNLHWNSIGEEFNDAHKSISTDYYELCDKYIDSTAEMIARLGKNPYNYKEVCSVVFPQVQEPVVKESSYSSLLEYSDLAVGYILIDSNILYTRKDIIEKSNIMLKDILRLIEDCLSAEGSDNIENVGIKSDLEAMHSEFDLQYRYINRRRIM